MFEKPRQSSSLTERTRYSDPNNKDINCERNGCNRHSGTSREIVKAIRNTINIFPWKIKDFLSSINLM